MGVTGTVPTGLHRAGRVSPRRLRLAAALVVLNLLDVLVTRAVLASGGIEANPVMRGLMEGLAAPLGLKLAVAAVAGGLLLCCPEPSRLADNAVRAVVAAYTVVVLYNAAVVVWLQLAGN